MAKVKVVDKRVVMQRWQIIRYQLLTHCYINGMQVSDSYLDCLTLLGLNGPSELSKFCNMAVDKDIFKVPQTVRNCISKAEKAGLISKHGEGRKKIWLNPDLKIQCEGSILLNYKIAYIDTKESQGTHKANSREAQLVT